MPFVSVTVPINVAIQQHSNSFVACHRMEVTVDIPIAGDELECIGSIDTLKQDVRFPKKIEYFAYKEGIYRQLGSHTNDPLNVDHLQELCDLKTRFVGNIEHELDFYDYPFADYYLDEYEGRKLEKSRIFNDYSNDRIPTLYTLMDENGTKIISLEKKEAFVKKCQEKRVEVVKMFAAGTLLVHDGKILKKTDLPRIALNIDDVELGRVEEGAVFLSAVPSDCVGFDGISFKANPLHLEGLQSNLELEIERIKATERDADVQFDIVVRPFDQSTLRGFENFDLTADRNEASTGVYRKLLSDLKLIEKRYPSVRSSVERMRIMVEMIQEISDDSTIDTLRRLYALEREKAVIQMVKRHYRGFEHAPIVNLAASSHVINFLIEEHDMDEDAVLSM